ncbi:unnamed protein product [Withania somnifera]
MDNKKDGNEMLAVPSSSSSDADGYVKLLVESPILFFVLSHKAVEIELAQIHRVAVEALDSGGEVVDELCRRLHFLKLVYKYHCAAVLFQALDARVKNVIFTYSLEHNSIDVLFSSIFNCLDRLQKEKEEVPVLFNELTYSIGTIQTTISQHMLKEEEQIFPLMVQKFSPKEQARLVWQYLCSVPLMILEDFMPWLTASLSSHEKADFLKFIHIVVPEEKLIQEVFVSWLDDNKEASRRSCIKYGKKTPEIAILHEGIQLKVFIDMLCQEVESFVGRMNKKLQFLETEVFVFIRETCSHEFQLWLLYMSLHMLPLGLLKCMIIWFSAHLSEYESKMILNNIKLGSTVVKKSFATLLYEWVKKGYSGKISVEKFRKDLEEMFSNRSYLFEKWSKNSGSSSLHSEMRSSDRFKTLLLGPNSAMTSDNIISHPSILDYIMKHDTPYSSGISLNIFFSDSLKNLCCLPETTVDDIGFSSIDVKPIDFFHFFHRALKKDLQYVLSLSVKLAEDVGLLSEFERHFHHVQFLYELHSKSEDEIAFPALESKGKLQNVTHSYGIDHKLEVEQFSKISIILNEISSLQGDVDMVDSNKLKHKNLCLNLHDTCISMHKTFTDHIYREEVELWPLFKEHFSVEEQEKIIGDMLGRTKVENIQEMIPWLMVSLTPEEQHGIILTWRKVTKNTKFFEWLGEWWEGIKRDEKAVSTYLSRDDFRNSSVCHKIRENFSLTESKAKGNKDVGRSVNITQHSTEVDKKRCNYTVDIADQRETACQDIKLYEQSSQKESKEHHSILTQDKLVDVIRRVSCDSSLDSEKKSHLMQSLLMSQWILIQEKSHSEVANAMDKEKITGQCPSFRDKTESVFGCKHYKRNCKLFAPCCNELFPCIRCHDEITDHCLDRKSITQCMRCLKIQPICPSCLTLTCNNFSMAKYYCRICKVFDDDRQIYHCPFCNLCRLGKGLGIGFFHCMTCNACMSKALSIHTCREKCLEDNCPICHEDIFTSALRDFLDYTYTHYTCPICSKTIGDVKVLFEVLDAMLSEEKIPEEYAGQTVILCNDCQKRGTASFHWHYHKVHTIQGLSDLNPECV